MIARRMALLTLITWSGVVFSAGSSTNLVERLQGYAYSAWELSSREELRVLYGKLVLTAAAISSFDVGLSSDSRGVGDVCADLFDAVVKKRANLSQPGSPAKVGQSMMEDFGREDRHDEIGVLSQHLKNVCRRSYQRGMFEANVKTYVYNVASREQQTQLITMLNALATPFEAQAVIDLFFETANVALTGLLKHDLFVPLVLPDDADDVLSRFSQLNVHKKPLCLRHASCERIGVTKKPVNISGRQKKMVRHRRRTTSIRPVHRPKSDSQIWY